ncbi:MAG: hypothetical protein H6814_00150 [Phycisphaeraceae bacterium]|nr:hypothetical protein [Phycisphaeraceae bacterium]
MSAKLRMLFVTLGAASAASLAHAWGGVGHIAITELALDAAAYEMPEWVNNALFRQRVDFMCNEPDRRRGVELVCLDHENNPEHYIDVEQLADFDLTLGTLPVLRYDYVLAMSEAMHREPERFEQDAPDEAGISWMPGTLPYAMAEDYAKLVAAFRMCRILETFADDDPLRANELEQARAEAAYHMGVLSHWVGDCAQPLHATVHHHGWVGDNPEGYTTSGRIHGYIDSGVLRAHDLSAATLVGAVHIDPIRIADPANPWPEFIAEIERSLEQVEPLYAMERDDQLETDKGREFIVERLSDAAGTLSGLYIAAWKQSEITDSDIASYQRYEAPSPNQK